MGWVGLGYISQKWNLPVEERRGEGSGTHCIHACILQDEAKFILNEGQD